MGKSQESKQAREARGWILLWTHRHYPWQGAYLCLQWLLYVYAIKVCAARNEYSEIKAQLVGQQELVRKLQQALESITNSKNSLQTELQTAQDQLKESEERALSLQRDAAAADGHDAPVVLEPSTPQPAQPAQPPQAAAPSPATVPAPLEDDDEEDSGLAEWEADYRRDAGGMASDSDYEDE